MTQLALDIRTPASHAARLSRSERLRKVAAFWSDGLWHSTMETIGHCNVCAVNSVAHELRVNGYNVETKCEDKVWFYRIAELKAKMGEAR